MKTSLAITVSLLLLIFSNSFAVVKPASMLSPVPNEATSVASSKYSNFAKTKSTFYSRLLAKAVMLKAKKRNNKDFTEEEVKLFRMSKLAGIVGLGSVVLLFIPYIAIIAPFAAIAGLVLGIISVGKYKKLPNARGKTMAILGIVGGGLTILLGLAAIIIWAVVWAL